MWFSFTCWDAQIDYEDNYKYLGVDFTEYLSWAQLRYFVSANRAGNYLIGNGRNSGALVDEVPTHLYNMLPLPIIGYCSFMWDYKEYSDIAKIHYNLMRSITGAI